MKMQERLIVTSLLTVAGNFTRKFIPGQVFFCSYGWTTDKGNIDDEFFLVVWCNVEGADENFHTEMNFMAVARPHSVTGEGLLDCFQSTLNSIVISEVTINQCKFLIGLGTDGASSNIAAVGLRGIVEQKLPWVYWNWCFAHRIKLAIKDALSSTSFDLIDDIILKLYYIYEKSPKKCREH